MKRRSSKPELSLVPKAALDAIARAMAYGNRSYKRGDYYKGNPVDWLNAALRHLSAVSERVNRRGGNPRAVLEALDESGLPHAFHAIASLAITLAIAPRPHVRPAKAATSRSRRKPPATR